MLDPDRTPSPEGHPPVISEERAKQGRRGLHILIVLIVSAVLAGAVLIGLWTARSGDLNEVNAEHNAREPADAAPVDQSVEAARQGAEPSEMH